MSDRALRTNRPRQPCQGASRQLGSVLLGDHLGSYLHVGIGRAACGPSAGAVGIHIGSIHVEAHVAHAGELLALWAGLD
eukprot:scaffold3020_cov342-Prasinococcus_capsulatus_cf.AAC.14